MTGKENRVLFILQVPDHVLYNSHCLLLLIIHLQFYAEQTIAI